MGAASNLLKKRVFWRRSPQSVQTSRCGSWATCGVTLVLAGLALLLGRVVQLKVWPDARLLSAAGTSVSGRSEMTRRGDLLDRQGRLIATSLVGHRLFVDPQAVEDPLTVAVDIGGLIGVDPVPIDRRIAQRLDRRYVVVADPLASWQVDAVRRADIKGVGLEPRLIRHYPSAVGQGLVGLVGVDHTGLGGLEHAFDRQLQQDNGRLTYLRDAKRRPMWVTPDGYHRGRGGKRVQLSVDLVIQESAERHLAAAVEQHGAAGGRLVVADCRTGEILAMTDVLQPTPGRPDPIVDPGRDRHPGLGRNRCVTDPYEPGSTFKPFVWAVATEQGAAVPPEVLPTPPHSGYRTGEGRLIRDTTYHPDSAWEMVLVKSINSGMAIVAERMTDGQMQDAVARFGFGRRTNCGLRGESAGIVTPPSRWNHYTQTSVAMGHEIAVTPVQMVRAFSAFARGGTLPRLRIIADDPSNNVYRFVHRVLQPETAETVKRTLKRVMHEGTGRLAQSERYELFGKSGTAQLPKSDGSGYYEDRYVSSFIAGAPFDAPRIVVLCVLDDPDKERGHYGGAIAGPVVRDVIDETLAYLGEPATPGDDQQQVLATDGSP